jgi:hypothetical protein
LSEILGENSPITIQAIIDPTGTSESVYGVFDDVDYKGNKDGGNVRQYLDGRRFILSTPPTIDVYENKTIYFPDMDESFIITRIDKDASGAAVLWVY